MIMNDEPTEERSPEQKAAEEYVKGYQAGDEDHRRIMAFLAGIAWERKRQQEESDKAFEGMLDERNAANEKILDVLK